MNSSQIQRIFHCGATVAAKAFERLGLLRASPKDGFSIAIHQAALKMSAQMAPSTCCGIVFSMDRALQLHALLGSYRDQVVNGTKLVIIYRVSSQDHKRAYDMVLAEFQDVIANSILQETRESFREIVIESLKSNSAQTVFFLVDDNLFVESVDLSALATHATPFSVPSMRMGRNLTKSYTVQKAQVRPIFNEHIAFAEGSDVHTTSPDLLSWHWGSGTLDWAYPLSVDGHLLPRLEVLAMAQAIDFNSPNTFESNLQAFNPAYMWRVGICFNKSRLINIPYNKVQSDFANLHGAIHQDEMLELWNAGQRIDRSAYYGMVNESAHQELPLKLLKASPR